MPFEVASVCPVVADPEITGSAVFFGALERVTVTPEKTYVRLSFESARSPNTCEPFDSVVVSRVAEPPVVN